MVSAACPTKEWLIVCDCCCLCLTATATLIISVPGPIRWQ
jgi:hypothetical protein